MEFKVCVFVTLDVYDCISHTFTRKTEAQYFNCMNDAIDYIKVIDYPPTKISIHLVTH